MFVEETTVEWMESRVKFSATTSEELAAPLKEHRREKRQASIGIAQARATALIVVSGTGRKAAVRLASKC